MRMVTTECLHCGEPALDSENTTQVCVIRAMPGYDPRVSLVETGLVHTECHIRANVGGIGHHLDCAHWCDQMNDPDGGRTYRQSALEVAAAYHGNN